MIPRQMFFFWCGRSMSWMRYMTIRSFRALNPDWNIAIFTCGHELIGQYQTWPTHERQDFFKYDGPDYSRQAFDLADRIESWAPEKGKESNPVAESDLFQWSIIAERGGYYSDMDVLWIEPLDSIHASFSNSHLLLCFANWFVTIGFFGAIKECPVIQHTLNCARNNFNPSQYQSCGSLSLMDAIGYRGFVQFSSRKRQNGESIRRRHITRAIERTHPDVQVRYLNGTTIYPWTWPESKKLFCQASENLPADTIGMHWYAGAKISQRYNVLLNENNLCLHRSIFTTQAKRVLDMSSELK